MQPLQKILIDKLVENDPISHPERFDEWTDYFKKALVLNVPAGEDLSDEDLDSLVSYAVGLLAGLRHLLDEGLLTHDDLIEMRKKHEAIFNQEFGGTPDGTD